MGDNNSREGTTKNILPADRHGTVSTSKTSGNDGETFATYAKRKFLGDNDSDESETEKTNHPASNSDLKPAAKDSCTLPFAWKDECVQQKPNTTDQDSQQGRRRESDRLSVQLSRWRKPEMMDDLKIAADAIDIFSENKKLTAVRQQLKTENEALRLENQNLRKIKAIKQSESLALASQGTSDSGSQMDGIAEEEQHPVFSGSGPDDAGLGAQQNVPGFRDPVARYSQPVPSNNATTAASSPHLHPNDDNALVAALVQLMAQVPQQESGDQFMPDVSDTSNQNPSLYHDGTATSNHNLPLHHDGVTRQVVNPSASSSSVAADQQNSNHISPLIGLTEKDLQVGNTFPGLESNTAVQSLLRPRAGTSGTQGSTDRAGVPENTVDCASPTLPMNQNLLQQLCSLSPAQVNWLIQMLQASQNE